MAEPQTETKYFASHDGVVDGPLDLDLIEAMILSGHYTQGVQIRAESSQTWNPHSVTTQVTPPPLPKSAVPNKTNSPPTPKWVFWLAAAAVVGFIILAIHPSPSSSSTATPSSAGSYQTRNSTAIARTSSSFTSTARTPQRYIYTDSEGHRFSVPYDQSARLSERYDALQSEWNSIEATKSKHTTESNSIDFDEAYLDRSDPYAVNALRQRMNNFNLENERLKQRVNNYNRKVTDLDWELRRLGTPVP
jgi:hypothetical protein